ncbi:MAG TPA: DoxX family protein, partial [Candidatus Binatia bacterium]|nr:DoxX family protein [Candidatus Binatia bacterium]
MKTDINLSSADTGTTKGALWIGWIMSTLPALFLFVDSVMKLVKPPPVVQATVELGYPETSIIGLGIVLL